jgi:O-antigen ligase
VASASGVGYAASRWYPLTIFLFVLLAVCLFTLPRMAPPSRATTIACIALIAFGVWSLLSILWAADQGAAWEGADRTLLYVAAFVLFALWPLRAKAAAIVLGAWTAWIVGLGVATQLRIRNVANPDTLFDRERLYQPAGYVNAAAAVFLMAVPAALALASRREVPWWLRGCFAGGVVVLVDTALLAQSRGATIALPIVLGAYFLFVPGRVRSLVTAVPIAAGIAATATRVLDVADRILGGASVREAVAGVPGAVLTAAIAVGVVVAVGGFAEGRLSLGHAKLQRAHRLIGGLGLAAVVVATGAAAVAIGNPLHRGDHLWKTFKNQTYDDITLNSSRLSQGLGGSRYDFYRVALDQFSDHPVIGIGADNYLQPYLRERNSAETPRYPHSLELRTLSQLGLVGTALLLGFLAAAAAALWPGLRRGTTLARVTCGAAAGVFAYWFVHGSGDWFFEYAGLAAPAFALLGVAVAVAPRRPGGERAGYPWLSGTRAIAGAGVVAVAAAFILVAPWLSARWVSYASNEWRSDPSAAFAHLRDAADANPLSDRPYLTGGVIATSMGDLARARGEFERALARDDGNAFTLLQLGAIASETGRRGTALIYLERARRLDPRDPVTATATAAVRRGRRVKVATMNRAILRRVESLVK